MWDFMQISVVATCIQGLGSVVESFGNRLRQAIAISEGDVFGSWGHGDVINVWGFLTFGRLLVFLLASPSMSNVLGRLWYKHNLFTRSFAKKHLILVIPSRFFLMCTCSYIGKCSLGILNLDHWSGSFLFGCVVLICRTLSYILLTSILHPPTFKCTC